MIPSTQKMIELEKKQLDEYGKHYSGSELAEFVAKRTRAFLLQQLIKEAEYRFDKQTVRWLRAFEDEVK